MSATTDNRRAARFTLAHPAQGLQTIAEFDRKFEDGGIGILLGVDISYTISNRPDEFRLLSVYAGSKFGHRVVFDQNMVNDLTITLFHDVQHIGLAEISCQRLHVSLYKRANVERCILVADRIMEYLGMDDLKERPWMELHANVMYPYMF